MRLLSEDWFSEIDPEEIQIKSKLYAGLHFGLPNWQKDAILPDDSDRKLLRSFLPLFVEDKKLQIKNEINFLMKWIRSETNDYHSFKMKNCNDFMI